MSDEREASELQAPPEPVYMSGMPDKALSADQDALRREVTPRGMFDVRRRRPSIARAAAMFDEKCAGGGAYGNNCAHFLSNAFILAGYTDLLRGQPYIAARCGNPDCHPPGAKGRPIRAKNMHEWFKVKGGPNKRLFPKNSSAEFKRAMRNTGFWAVFEHDADAYWGGHVCIVDTNTWKVYGTGRHGYWDWAQYCYRW